MRRPLSIERPISFGNDFQSRLDQANGKLIEAQSIKEEARRLQLGDVTPHLPLTGRELGCKLVHALAHRGEIERKLLQIG